MFDDAELNAIKNLLELLNRASPEAFVNPLCLTFYIKNIEFRIFETSSGKNGLIKEVYSVAKL